ncbi:MAG: hypothetical protein ACI93R_002029 [Flavobacteriales bacterium]|jgi:hypothetical protein
MVHTLEGVIYETAHLNRRQESVRHRAAKFRTDNRNQLHRQAMYLLHKPPIPNPLGQSHAQHEFQ